MEQILLILFVAAVVGLSIGIMLWKMFVPEYLAEKAKNLASKEDLAQLTAVVESVKASHSVELERLKATLVVEAQIMELRRKVYEEMCDALRVFIDGHGGVGIEEAKRKFYTVYATAWLWASDEVINELNHFIALQIQFASDRTSVPQHQLKVSYASTVLAMRKDVGFPNTIVEEGSYQFVQF